MGITGVREDLDELARGVVGKVRKADPDKFVAVGIGVSTGEQAREVNDYADGAIVGSVFVRAFQSGGIAALANKVRELVAGLNK
jgi:tryptophan synthase alpha chain